MIKKKILHITQAVGGIETHLLLLFRYLNREKYDLYLSCPLDGTLAHKAKEMGIIVIPNSMCRNPSLFRDIKNLWFLYKLIKHEQFDIVHTHSSKAGFIGRIAAKLAGTPLVIFTPNAFSYLSTQGIGSKFYLLLEKFACHFTDILIATSPSEANQAVNVVGFNSNKVKIVCNAIEVPSESEINETQQIIKDNSITMVGRLTYQKNPEMFLKVAEEVIRILPDCKFSIIGAGLNSPLEKKVREKLNSMDVSDKIQVIPWTNKVHEYIRNASIVISTSRYEGLPYSLLEAMALAKPIVATDVDGNRDVVINGINGYLVPFGDVNSFVKKVVELVKNKGLRKKMGEEGYRILKEKFNIKDNICLLEMIYDML